MKKLLFSVFVVFAGLQYGFTQDLLPAVRSYLNENAKELKLSPTDIADIKISSQSFSKSLNAYNVYVDQNYRGVRIFNSSSSFVIKDNQVKSGKLSFVEEIAAKINGNAPAFPALSAISKAVAKLGIASPSGIKLLDMKGEHAYVFSDGGISLENIPVELVYQPVNNGEKLHLAWDLSIYLLDGSHYYSVRIDAQSGEIISLDDLVISCAMGDEPHSHASRESVLFGNKSQAAQMILNSNEPKYRVFPIPYESPQDGEDQLVTDPSDAVASLFGWHDTDGIPGHEYTITRGNNVYAYEDHAFNNIPGNSADGGEEMLFDFPYNLPQNPHNFTDAAITNLFYMNNIMHDVFYNYGFDEASGNFQYNNYGRGGTERDAVMAEAQDGQGTNNANFATGSDGVSPRMQMYLWRAPGQVLGTFLTLNNSPLQGKYYSQKAQFGPGVTTTEVTANLVLVQTVNTDDPYDACGTLSNAAALAGKIAVINRGSCGFAEKVMNAQNAGAVGVIIVNNVLGDPILMGGEGPDVTIPAVLIYKRDGEAIIEALLAGTEINATLKDDGSGVDTNRRDGDLDNVVVAHEYGHGISVRLTGGRFRVNCLFNEEQMGEGWSDYFGLMLTMKPGDRGSDIRGIGTYALGQGVEGAGLRARPYTTDMTLNPFTYNNVKTQAVPHGVGSVWATMLWDMTWAFIDEYGFDPDIYEGTGGNNKALQLVVDGLKIQPCSPGFVDGRDAILEADRIANGGENKCLIWHAFARRGLGLSADQGSSHSKSDGTQAFDVPQECRLGVGEHDNIRNKFVIYPNPAEGIVNIQTRFEVSGAEINIYDMNGRKVLNTTLNLHGDSSIDISNLAAGLYMVNIEGGGFSQTTKLVVQ
ncbi:MAG TPA: T9SS-dependent M36 family metallopeptidase [Flavobacteriaceae bacterium]|nr:T9SS-dependent M36 family metallopeptidase [Flavobacteriaceae bacterium]